MQRHDPFSIDSHKIHQHFDRLKQWQENPQRTFPLYVEISPVGHCNHRCTFCAVDYIGYKTRALSYEVLVKRLNEMAELGVRSVMFAGEGEPLLHPKLAEVISQTKDAGMAYAITTNGVALTPKFCRTALKGIQWVKVSMNGGSRTYRQVHKAGLTDYDRVWHNLELANLQRRDESLDTVLGIQAVLLPENVQDMRELAERSLIAGLDYLVIKPYSQHQSSLTTQYKDVHYQGYEELFKTLEEYSTDKFQVIIRRKSMASWDSPARGYQKCYSTPYFWAYIMANGDVYGCSAYLLDDRFCYGNIQESAFKDIWLGEKRKESMRYVANDLCIQECRKNCRMDKVNQFLWEMKNPGPHHAFI